MNLRYLSHLAIIMFVIFSAGCATVKGSKASVPEPTLRDEHMGIEYKADLKVELIKPAKRVSATHTGMQIVPLFPILPASLIHNSPSVIQIEASEKIAYDRALKKSPSAHTLVDVQTKRSTDHYLLFTQTTVYVSGVPARFTD